MPPSAIIHKLFRSQRPGASLLMTLIFLGIVAVLVSVTLKNTYSYTNVTSRRVNDQEAVRVAEAGIEKAVWCLNNPNNSTDCPRGGGNYVGETGVSIGRGTYTTSVSASGSTATVTSTSTVSGTGGTSTKQLQIKLKTDNTYVSFNYGIQVGTGGITMGNGNTISGNVYSSGSIVAGSGSSITGNAVLSVGAPTPDVSSDPPVSPLVTQNIGDVNGNLYMAQKFLAGVDERLYRIDLRIAKHGCNSCSITAYVYSDNSGNPGSDISAGGQVLTVDVDDTQPNWQNGWTNNVFTPGTQLVAGVPYWLVFKASGANASNYWKIVSGVDTTYANGTTKSGAAAGTITTAKNIDLAIRTNMGGVTPTLDISNVSGSAYAHTMNSVTVGNDAYYQALSGTVEANNGAETCSTSTNGTYCHRNSPNQAPQNFPISDSKIQTMAAQGTAGGMESSNCTINGGTIGPKEYDCDVTLSGTVTLAGTVWVKGDLTISGTLKLSDGYGNTNGVIIADDPANITTKGHISVSPGGDILGNATSGTFIMAIATNSSLGQSPAAFDSTNGLSAGIVYAPNGSFDVKNGGDFKELSAQKIYFKNGSTLSYQSGLANAVFSSGPGASWTLQKGTYQILE